MIGSTAGLSKARGELSKCISVVIYIEAGIPHLCNARCKGTDSYAVFLHKEPFIPRLRDARLKGLVLAVTDHIVIHAVFVCFDSRLFAAPEKAAEKV